MATTATKKALAWPLFDSIVEHARRRSETPWDGDTFVPDYPTLERLLGVPLALRAGTTSGVPALALDVWASYELRRAGFHADRIWPRAEPPRVVSRDLLRFIDSLPRGIQRDLRQRIRRGTNNKTTGQSAVLLGKNYTKQVDVVMSSWETGPELLISTKRMDSSFGNNAANRIEESYGDAKNLRLRYPQAACGFLYVLRSTAWDSAPAVGETPIAERLVDLLGKLGQEPDAYHATALVVPEYASLTADEDVDDTDTEPEDVASDEPGVAAAEELVDVDRTEIPDPHGLPEVRIRLDLVAPEVDPGRFFRIMVETVLRNTPVSYHREARRLRGRHHERGGFA